MKVIILAGGLGTRLRDVINDVPKPMADINGRPFLELLLDNLLFFGASEFIICVSYLKEHIINYFGTNYKTIPIYYSVEEEPLGTGGAIKQAFELYHIENALVINGDSFLQLDYAQFYKQNLEQKLAIALRYVENANRYGLVELKNNIVKSFTEKKDEQKAGYINGGIYYINKSLFENTTKKVFSFETEILEKVVHEINVPAIIADNYFIDIGIPESYYKACNELIDIVYPNKAIFLDRDGVINVDKNYVHKIEDCEFIEGIFDFCRKAKTQGYLLIVITNQAGIGKGYFSIEQYNIFMDYIKEQFIKENCPLDDIFFCPYHIDGIGGYKLDSIDRKPNPGMIWKACAKHKINVQQSILIGDKETDIEAGKQANISNCILLKDNNFEGIL